MSTIHDEIEPTYNFFDENNLSDKFLEENNSYYDSNNNNSISLNEELFDNNKFLNNFMKIYSFELSSNNNNNNNNNDNDINYSISNKTTNNNESNIIIDSNKNNENNIHYIFSISSINSSIQNSNLQKKTYREKTNKTGILYDELTKITYYEKDDPIAYKKAKKRIQNRESALRMKKLNLTQKKSIEEEIYLLKEENKTLKEDNLTLKKEKNFLIEQIKCMQNILKESNIDLITLINNNNKINQKKITQQILNYDNEKIFYDGSKQIIKGKLFNVFTICLLSILYIAGDNNYSDENNNLGQKHSTIVLNSLNETKKKSNFSFWGIISKIILIIIFCLIIPWIKTFYNFIILIKRKNKKIK